MPVDGDLIPTVPSGPIPPAVGRSLFDDEVDWTHFLVEGELTAALQQEPLELRAKAVSKPPLRSSGDLEKIDDSKDARMSLL